MGPATPPAATRVGRQRIYGKYFEAMNFLQRLKRSVVPRGLHERALPLGLSRGIIMPIDFSHESRLYLGVYEIELNRHIKAICQDGVSSFDVGGQHGYDALVFAKLTGARVVSFEADPQAASRIRETVELNDRLRSHVEVVEGFVGDGPNEVGLDEFAYSPDGFVPGFIKLDIEGGETAALRSATRLLRDAHPRLIVEVHSRQAEAESGRILVDHGYCPTIVNQRRVFKERRPTEHNRWLVA